MRPNEAKETYPLLDSEYYEYSSCEQRIFRRMNSSNGRITMLSLLCLTIFICIEIAAIKNNLPDLNHSNDSNSNDSNWPYFEDIIPYVINNLENQNSTTHNQSYDLNDSIPLEVRKSL